ncbi:Bacteriophage P22, Gp10, DNA-stabilising [uncultured Caudovirales phage]|uniref:Bacteriophage P22, Gp10, DNA-stabilising n=1 Tax=uncultured Caudovirales phage TaxID=2100421 RepID=A0A6J5KZZ5_9CAUD|nr:Bacteriophage P22, Gp10, DNA-stabilising [uncultured Caudovirales phage]CAB4133023.1 Bacteriophage P22, Gp10, DNA-stabilising [uncultured Caudovirales phage]
MKTPILGSSYVARSVNAADNRMVNLFPEATPEGGKTAGFLNRAPGLRKVATVGTGPIRGLWQFGNYGYVVSGTEVYKIDTSWNSTLLGTVTGTGPVSMSDNGTQLFIACNPDGYIYNSFTNVFAKITDPDYPGAVTVGYIDGYFVFNQPDSQKLWITQLLDGTQVDPLDFASAEGSPDGVVSLIVDHREIWVFGTNSIEVWYDAGNADFPLARIQGAFNEIGCAAPYSVAKLDNALFWLGADARGRGIVYRANGYTGQRVSTHAVEWQIQNYGNISDAIAYTYQQDGHAFYVLIFPSADTTWVYDVATGSWHERAGWTGDAFTRHRSNCQMAFNSEIVVGDYENGNVYVFDLDVYADNGSEQRWMRSWRALPPNENNLKRTSHHGLQIDCETGVGLQGYDANDPLPDLLTEAGDPLLSESGYEILISVTTVQGANPQMMLRWSDDGGHTWTGDRWASMGRIGQYGTRTFFRRLGMTTKIRDRVYEISGTDPVKVSIVGAELIVTPTNA